MSLLFGLIQTVVAVALLVYAFRMHERFWTLGFLGWRKVYTGLGLSLLGGLAATAAHWSGAGGNAVWWAVSAAMGGLGLALVLAGSVERLHDLAVERRQMEDVRAGYDLFDTLREVVGGAYAFLEVLDFALKEMVRASGATTGGLWLHNPAGREWVLTGAAGMSQTFRQQIESVRGSGTGFDRLARTSKARIFSRADEIRLFFPEWEAEGYHSVLGLPLVTAVAGSSEKHLLGVIVLADQSESRFDDDRARRLHAAADYVAAVVAEARLQRQLEAANKQNESQRAEAEARLQEVEHRLTAASERFAAERREWEAQTTALVELHEDHLETMLSESGVTARRLEAEFEDRLAEAVRRHEELHAQWQEVHQAEQRLRESLDVERQEWARRSEEWQRESTAQRDEWEKQRTMRETQIDQLRAEIAARDDESSRRSRAYEEQLQALRAQTEEQLRAAAEEQRRLREELQALHTTVGERERHWAAESDAERRRAREDHDRLTAELQSVRADMTERERQWEAQRDAERGQARADHDQVSAELQSVRAEMAERERAVAAERAAERQQATDEIIRWQSEAEARRSELATREREMTEERETARQHVAALEEHHAGQLAAERETIRQIEDSARAERQEAAEGMALLERRIDSLQDLNDRALERWRSELEQYRGDSRRRLDEVAGKLVGAERIITDVAAALTDPDPIDALIGTMRRQLPEPEHAELWLWRRLPDATPSLVRVCGHESVHPHAGLHTLSPWMFEADTIPAEGITVVRDAGNWATKEEHQDQYHRERWDEVWGKDRRPCWAVCWPWAQAGGAAGENGWITAFGFGAGPLPDPMQIEQSATYAALIGALVGATPQQREMDLQAESAEPPIPEPVDVDIPAPTPIEASNSESDLHAAILAWVANQQQDEWHLSLAAPTPPAVDAHWLGEILTQARSSCCNGGDGSPNKFTLETSSADGGAQLRLLNLSVDGTVGDLVSVGWDSTDPGRTGGRAANAAVFRWLMHGDHRLGIEIVFRAADPAHSQETVPSPTASPAGFRLSALIADDQPAVAELVAGMLESLGHEAVVTGGAQEAYGRFVTEHFDVVIVSAAMPQRTGPALAGWIKSHRPETPVVLLTEPGIEDGPGAFEPNWDRVLEKPFDLYQLQDCLASLRETPAVVPPNDPVGEMIA